MKIVLTTLTISVCIFWTYYCNAEEREQRMLMPKKVEADTNYDGKIDRIEYYNDKGEIEKTEADTTGDGIIDEWVTYKNGKPLKSERDTNADKKPDIWIEY